MHPPFTTQEWLEYYEQNVAQRLSIPWNQSSPLSLAESRDIIPSLQAWQLGETSDGRHLLAAANRYAIATADPDFLDVVRLFIAEEQYHGETLGQFLDSQGAPRIKKNWGDTLFRKLRYFIPNLELWTTAVIVVETLALVYYRAVMQASTSPVLQTICRQILRDEVYHLRFQYERLAQIQSHRRPWPRFFTFLVQYALFFGTTLLVWIGHHRLLKAGGYPFFRYWRAAWNRMHFHWRRLRNLHRDQLVQPSDVPCRPKHDAVSPFTVQTSFRP